MFFCLIELCCLVGRVLSLLSHTFSFRRHIISVPPFFCLTLLFAHSHTLSLYFSISLYAIRHQPHPHHAPTPPPSLTHASHSARLTSLADRLHRTLIATPCGGGVAFSAAVRALLRREAAWCAHLCMHHSLAGNLCLCFSYDLFTALVGEISCMFRSEIGRKSIVFLDFFQRETTSQTIIIDFILFSPPVYVYRRSSWKDGGCAPMLSEADIAAAAAAAASETGNEGDDKKRSAAESAGVSAEVRLRFCSSPSYNGKSTINIHRSINWNESYSRQTNHRVRHQHQSFPFYVFPEKFTRFSRHHIFNYLLSAQVLAKRARMAAPAAKKSVFMPPTTLGTHNLLCTFNWFVFAVFMQHMHVSFSV